MNGDVLNRINLSWIDKRMKMRPVEFGILNIDKEISKYGLQEITSHSIFDATTKKFHSQGLFSEVIFGSTIDPKRFITPAYIDLKTDVFQPHIYDIIIGLKRIYVNIMAGKLVARFDEESNEFIVCTKEEEGSGTGYSFFIENFMKKKFDPNDYESLTRKNEINTLIKYKDNWFCDKHLVLPAGIRDIEEENGRISQESVNKIYLSLLSLSNSFYEKSNDKIYDNVRWSIQQRIHDSYMYIQGFTRYKKMFIQKNYGARTIALGTRNVASAPLLSGNSPDDETIIKFDETQLPLYQCMKAFQHHVIHYLKEFIFKDIVGESGSKAYLIDPKTKELRYINISFKEREKLTNPVQLEKIINKFRYVDFRNSAISILGKDGLKYYIFEVYDDGNDIFIYRSINELLSYKKIETLSEIDKNRIRYLTWAELLYLVTYIATRDKHNTNTRYPVIEDGSIYPSKVHLLSTIPSRSVDLKFFTVQMHFPHYPIIGNKYYDSFSVHSTRLVAMDMDFDGDMGNINGIMSDDGNKEVEDYLNSPLSMINSNFDLITSGDIKDANFVLQNITG